MKATQKKQKRDYDRRRTSKTEIKVDDIVLLKNNKRFDQKDGKFSQNGWVLTMLWISLTKELWL